MVNSNALPDHGVGLGLRRDFIEAFLQHASPDVDFLEIAPENWIDVGGRYGTMLAALAERYPIVAHGLSLSLGATVPLNQALLQSLKQFFERYPIAYYSEHLSYCSDQRGYLYDLLPVPFTEQAVVGIAARIRYVQDFLGRRIAIENVSYYAPLATQMTEQAFITAVLEEADCDLLLDINNIYVNSINHGYDATAFMRSMPRERIRYLHVAGHYKERDDLLIDTHGTAVNSAVWDLLQVAYDHFGPLPTLLERDFHIPSLPELLQELALIRQLQLQAKSNRSLRVVNEDCEGREQQRRKFMCEEYIEHPMQETLAAYLRNPSNLPPITEMPIDRVQIYRDLLLSNIEGMLRQHFPVLYSCTISAGWHAKAQEFFAEYPCQSPYFKDIAPAFVEFLQKSLWQEVPFATELARYEWIETELQLLDVASTAVPLHDEVVDVWSSVWQCAASVRLGNYRFPVHRIAPDHQPTQASSTLTYLLVYRDRRDRVQFIELNLLTYHVLASIEQQAITGQGLLTPWLAEQAALSLEEFQGHLESMLRQFYAMGVITR